MPVAVTVIMKFLILALFISIFSRTCSQTINDDKSSYKDVIEKLEQFNSSSLQKIEERLDMRKDEMLTVLKQGGKEAKSVKAAIDLFLENAELRSERSHINYLVENVFIPGKIPHQFFCAMAVYEDILQHVYQRKGVNLYKPKFGDDPVDRTRNEPLFLTESLIEELGRRAPEIDPEIIKMTAYDNLPPFRGPASKIYHYHDSIITNYIAWKSFIGEAVLPLAKSIIVEMKLKYGDNWKKFVPEFSLVHARGWPLSGHVQHKLLREYVNFLNREHSAAKDFDSVLQKLMPTGWYFPARHMEFVNLLIRAVHNCDSYGVKELGFETFLLNKAYVLPQSTACSSSKSRNLSWYMTSSIATPRSHSEPPEDHHH